MRKYSVLEHMTPERKYLVLEHMPLEVASILVQALFEKWYNEDTLMISIAREPIKEEEKC